MVVNGGTHAKTSLQYNYYPLIQNIFHIYQFLPSPIPHYHSFINLQKSMVDCDFFTEFNHLLVLENNRLLLETKTSDYTIEILFPNQACKKIPKSTSTNFNKKTPIKAVYGIMEMEVNRYLVAVTKATVIGQIYHRKIFQVQKVDFICLNSTQDSKDKPYIKNMREILESKHMYFSDQYDLTNSFQTFIGSGCSLKNKRIQYMYNGAWIEEFIQIKAYEWITGFISGFISINFTHAGVNHACELALVTRRDARRQGLRWITRGADLDGNTVNTAETQTIFLTESNGKEQVFSYVQLRGSIPFLWQQTPDLKWSPKVVINPNDKLNTEITRKNYNDIKKNYQNCGLINLIDKKGSQKRMGDYFERMHMSVGQTDFRLVWFDFHAECKNMKYQNLARLLDIITKQIENYGYFHMESSSAGSRRSSKVNGQKGIFRTNCMDCLDRTNVVQSVLARQLLLAWLIKLGIVNKPRNMSAFEKLPDNLQQIFRVQWTNNADVLSILYSGTPAMKTDFTATGKRTTKGALKDGDTSIRRFFLGNFYDSRKQDYIDFSLGYIKPKKNPAEKIRHSAFNSLFFMVVFIIVIPFVVGWQVDTYVEEHENRGLIKVGAGLVSVLMMMKMFQIGHSILLRKPIRGNR